MKFLVSKNIHSNPNFTLLLGFYSFMLLLYFVGDLFFLAHFFGSIPQDVLITIKGDEEEFIEALSLLSFLEHIHISMFLAIMALFTTMAIVLRLDLKKTHKGIIITVSMASLLISSLCFLGTYFLADNFIYPFYFTALLWHAVGIYALSIVLFQLWIKKA